MKFKKNVSKLELKNSLLDSLARNDEAIDYIQNHIYRTENLLGLDPTDEEALRQIATERFIKFSLEYLKAMYEDNLKKLGVRI